MDGKILMMERSVQWHRTEARMKARRALRKRRYFPSGRPVWVVPDVVIAVDPAVPGQDKSAFLVTDEGGVVEVVPAKRGFRMRFRHVGWIVAIAVVGGLLWFLATTFWQLLHMM